MRFLSTQAVRAVAGNTTKIALGKMDKVIHKIAQHPAIFIGALASYGIFKGGKRFQKRI